MAIFPCSVTDMDQKVLSFCDTNSLIQLSGVNTIAYQVLSNKTFFQSRFKAQHSLLKNYDELCCALLRSSHSSNCWKVMCKEMDPVNREQFPRHFSASFIDEGAPYVKSKLYQDREKWQSKIKLICGTGYADPNSPIDKAWKEFKCCEREAEQCVGELQQRIAQLNKESHGIREQLQTVHSEEQYALLFGQLENHSSRFLKMTEKQFITLADGDRAGMVLKHLPLYREYAQVQEALLNVNGELDRILNQLDKVQSKYERLEETRSKTDDEIQTIDQALASFSTSHPNTLIGDFHQVLSLENALTIKPHLEKCLGFILKTKDPAAKTPALLASIRQSINDCTFDLEAPYWEAYCIWGSLIWRDLYFQCGNNIVEDSWAENHFQEFLPWLGRIIYGQLQLVRDRITYAEVAQRYTVAKNQDEASKIDFF